MSDHGYLACKRAVDVLVAGVGLVATAPLQVILALLVRRSLGSPVLFRQERPGKDEELFELVKFRTMREPSSDRHDASGTDRITPLGAWLRSTSLDELPSLWNVLKGDMSLVGPRPLLVSYLDRYSPEERRRHLVKPGLTGLAQIEGRNSIGWADKFALDLEYVARRSLVLDLTILVRTVPVVFGRVGVDASEEQTMPEYMGHGGAA